MQAAGNFLLAITASICAYAIIKKLEQKGYLG